MITSGGGGGGGLTRRDKVRRIFDLFDANGDGGLDRSEMAALVAAVNPGAHFTDDQISSILDEVFRLYHGFIPDASSGLSLAGLLRTYDDGAGDVDRDFAALFQPKPNPDPVASPLWPSSPNHDILYESSRRAIEDLKTLLRDRIRASASPKCAKDSIFFDGFSESGWGSEVKKGSWEYKSFLKQLKQIRTKLDRAPTREEAFEGHMAIGRTLHDRRMFSEALQSFRRAAELSPSDVCTHFRIGSALFSLRRPSEAKSSYLAALQFAEADPVRWSSLLPQIHVNLGVVMEGEGLLINASEQYLEATLLCPTHYRALKLLGSALFGIGEYDKAQKALEEAVLLKTEYADAHCDLGSVLHARGEDARAVLAFQTAIDLKIDHLEALYNLGGLFKDTGQYQSAAEMYERVLAIRPDNWQAQLNWAVALLVTGKSKDDAADWVVVDASMFKLVDEKTTDTKHLACALWIRELQKITKLGRCDVMLLKKEMDGVNDRAIRKAELEVILRKLLNAVKVESFQGAVKAIDQKIWAVLDVSSSGRVDLGMFFAIIAPICAGSPEKRKRAAFDALLWHPVKDGFKGQISKVDASVYFRYLRVIYFHSQAFSDLLEINAQEDEECPKISFPEFIGMFDDGDFGFGILPTVLKLEAGEKKEIRDDLDNNPNLKDKDELLLNHGCIQVPTDASLRSKLLEHFHNTPKVSYGGVLRTYKKLSYTYTWVEMKKDVKAHVRACETCQQAKKETLKPIGFLEHLPMLDRVWEDIFMDFIKRFPLEVVGASESKLKSDEANV
ncbi:uncharacterized TPR repeat-containing protein At2g32450-like [Typha latifolia]|uniref:uncharacterized TPR repeat-containing protein At2g32450-like n=1 Tax=Typha latifolia TaxID=4733 RepID=UPI003C2CB692